MEQSTGLSAFGGDNDTIKSWWLVEDSCIIKCKMQKYARRKFDHVSQILNAFIYYISVP